MTGAGAASHHNNNGAAEVEFYAQSEHFPELNMDKDTIREVKAAWLMFVVLQGGGPEAAEDAVCKKLQSVDSPFAQLLYPDKVNKRSSKGKNGDEWSAEGQRKKADDWSPEGRAAKYRRDQAAILRAGQDPRTDPGGRRGSGGGGGCPMGLGGGLGGAMGAFGDDMDLEEMREVMKIVQRANAAAAAAAKAQAAAGGEPAARDAVGRVKSLGAGVKADAKKFATNSGASADAKKFATNSGASVPHSASSKRAASAQRGASSKRAADAHGAGSGGDTGLASGASGGGASAGHVVHGVDLSVYKDRVSVGRGPSPGAEARRRSATPSGRSTAHMRRVSL